MDEHNSTRARTWSADEIRALGMVADLTTAASIFGLSRSVAYDLARRGEFPLPVLRFGSRYRVPVPAILAALQLGERLDPPADPSVDGSGRSAVQFRRAPAATVKRKNDG